MTMQLVATTARHSVTGSPAIVTLETASPAHREAHALYVECLSHLLDDETCTFHVLMAPNMGGPHQVFGADDGMEEIVAAVTGAEVGPLDCVVVLTKHILESDMTEDEMATAVLADISTHIGRIWPVADRSVGWCGRQIGWSALAGMFASAHPILSAMPLSGFGQSLHEQIRDVSVRSMRDEKYGGKDGAERMQAENGAAVEAIDLVLAASKATTGGLISLPTRVVDLVEAAKRMVSNTLDDMEVRPVGIV
jgi:hypothetical protein